MQPASSRAKSGKPALPLSGRKLQTLPNEKEKQPQIRSARGPGGRARLQPCGDDAAPLSPSPGRSWRCWCAVATAQRRARRCPGAAQGSGLREPRAQPGAQPAHPRAAGPGASRHGHGQPARRDGRGAPAQRSRQAAEHGQGCGCPPAARARLRSPGMAGRERGGAAGSTASGWRWERGVKCSGPGEVPAGRGETCPSIAVLPGSLYPGAVGCGARPAGVRWECFLLWAGSWESRVAGPRLPHLLSPRL